ncbi:hypothetical protein OPV22_033364 [Ensete ventricosum]|uniref:Uncharacterized protein n=1 Tax=Ensete ventricosum TaxID=4639 RepID=A0AAV8PU44_ENSVE|nr:hypothetical protein OPV22_033364 [Ensete ventricosum]
MTTVEEAITEGWGCTKESVEEAEGTEERAPTDNDSVRVAEGVEQQDGGVATGASQEEGRKKIDSITQEETEFQWTEVAGHAEEGSNASIPSLFHLHQKGMDQRKSGHASTPYTHAVVHASINNRMASSSSETFRCSTEKLFPSASSSSDSDLSNKDSDFKIPAYGEELGAACSQSALENGPSNNSTRKKANFDICFLDNVCYLL